MEQKTYIAIDLKSFYASVECVERGLDPLTTNLVVADASRTDKTICLAVTPSLKAYGISGRARLFEVVQKAKEINLLRQQKAPKKRLTGASWDAVALGSDSTLALDYIVAPPRMAHYIDYSTRVYGVYTVTPTLGASAAHNPGVKYTMAFKVTPHQLRHTYVTNLIYSGLNPKTVMFLAGHEDLAVTMKIYTHVKNRLPAELRGPINEVFPKPKAYG